MRAGSNFRRDESGTFHVILGILLVVAIPVILFVLLLRYLKRTAPEGSVMASDAQTPKPLEEEPLKGPAGRVAGARKCHRCGVAVKPHKGGGGIECPNCGAGLA